MKLLLPLLSLAVLGGCAYAPPVPPYQATRYAPPPADPSQWHVVSVTPVPLGTGERAAAASGTGAPVGTSSEPAPRTVYVPQPVYVAQPAYAPAPLYYAPAPSYYPPVSIGLDFMFGRSWGRHGRNFGGVGIGSRWGR